MKPTKPIGPFFTKTEAESHQRERNWKMIEDSGRGWRRVVASPDPKRIVESATIRTLVDAGNIVIAAGGGGIPVIETEDGTYRGVEAVIDKDLASVVLAQDVEADRLIIVTAVDAVAIHFGTDREKSIREMTVSEASDYLKEGHFPPGSMGPKILGAIRFLTNGGKEVIITSPHRLHKALSGEAGTRIIP